jgi:hypothetical protein
MKHSASLKATGRTLSLADTSGMNKGWESQMYCSVPQWIRLVQTMVTSSSNVTVQELDERVDCQYLKMRSMAIMEAQEAMEIGVSIRENGPTDFLA